MDQTNFEDFKNDSCFQKFWSSFMTALEKKRARGRPGETLRAILTACKNQPEPTYYYQDLNQGITEIFKEEKIQKENSKKNFYEDRMKWINLFIFIIAGKIMRKNFQ